VCYVDSHRAIEFAKEGAATVITKEGPAVVERDAGGAHLATAAGDPRAPPPPPPCHL
jgi:hypothetical protein